MRTYQEHLDFMVYPKPRGNNIAYPYTVEDDGDGISLQAGSVQKSKSEKETIAVEWNYQHEAEVARLSAFQKDMGNKTSAKLKLEALGLTTDEVKAAFGL